MESLRSKNNKNPLDTPEEINEDIIEEISID
jgi:hypothetical protein